MPRADKAGFPTYWTSFGQGPRHALMIHCSLSHSGSWGALARHMSGALTMTAFDMPGHGRSGDWGGDGEYQQVTTAIAASFCDGPVDVVGHSFGATVALRLAIERPELVRSLTLIEPVLFALARQSAPGMFALHEAQVAKFVQAMEAEDTMASAREFTEIWGDGTPWEAVPEQQRQTLADQMHLIKAGNTALYGDPGGMLKQGVLEQVTQPVLLIEGSRSPAIIPAIHQGLAERLPQTRRAVIVGARHMVPITHAAQVSDEMLRFLRSN